jgi:double-stranded uracil-DNA glycosylase
VVPDLSAPRKPTQEELLKAVNKTVPDVIAPGLRVLFCGINPGLYTAAVGHHFARPGNRFWPALHASGFSDRVLSPYEERALLRDGCGITNLVARATARADELSEAELLEGRRKLAAKARRFEPRYIAVLGIGAFRRAFQVPGASLGRQAETLGSSILWLLPNPSGLNAHHQPSTLAAYFSELHRAATSAGRTMARARRGS